MIEAFKFLWKSIAGYRKYYLIMIMAPIIGAFYKPLIFYSIKLIVDVLTTTDNFHYTQMLKPFLIYIFSDLGLTMLWRFSDYAEWKSQPYVQRKIVLNAVDVIFSYRYKFFQSASGGSISSKVKGLQDGFNNLWAQLHFGIVYWVVACITIGGSIALINKYLCLVIVVWALIYVCINYKLARQININSQEQNEAKHKVIGFVTDNFSNIFTLKNYTARFHERNQLFKLISSVYIPKEIKTLKYHFKVNIINDIFGIAIIAIIIVIMINLKYYKLISISDFVFVFGMIFQFQENLWRMMQEFHRLSNITGDLRSSMSILTADLSEYNGNSSNIDNKEAPQIQFRNMCFNYDNKQQLFDNFNLTIASGEKVGIVGYTGSGKSTLINLLMKFFTPDGGKILINDCDIATIDNDELRKMIAIIPQDISLFNRSLYDNIHYGNLNASYNDVVNASIKAHANDFINSLPDKYETMVGERGVKISGGQRQRISIARAILKNAPILILDEATSALDSITEKHIQASISELIKGKTVVAIAHRISTLRDMDRIIVMNKGHIIDIGKHDELLKKEDGLYYQIWHSQ